MNLTYDLYNRTEPTELYIAKPGKRIIGKIVGVQEDTAHVDINFNNANTLEFSLSRNINGKVNPIYDFVEFHYEIYAKGLGWFKIKEVPTIESNGENEVKNVSAEALETELQQYDLVDFEINTAQPASQEWNAVDNVYVNDDDIDMFHDGVLFYRDTSKLEELADYMKRSGNTSVESLQVAIGSYPDMFRSWRIDIRSTQAITYAINEAITIRQENGLEYQGLSDLLELEAIKKSDLIAIIDHYPEFFTRVLSYSIDDTYTDEDGDLQHYTGLELVELEIQRQKDLSLLDLILKEHGWKVGFVDDYISTDANAEEEEKEYLKNLVGTFQIDSMDIYSFLTQDVSQCFNCVFEFDADNYLVNALRLSHIGVDTSIALNFHNLQTSITRNSDRPLYTVYHIEGADNIDPTQVNYGLNYIEDISYFLNTDHFPQAFIDKYNNWKNAYEANRAEFCQKSIEYRDQLLVVTEINDRVPNDGCNTNQYRTFSDEELETEISVYQAQLAGYQALYVDDNNNFDINLLQQHKADYADYILIEQQIIQNIRRELSNRQVSSVEQQVKFLDGYKFNIATYGDAYGLHELKTLQTEFKGEVETMVKRGYNVDSEYNEDDTPKDTYKHELYLDYVKYNTTLSQINAEIVERQAEYDAAKELLDQIDSRRTELKQLVNKENYFTQEELDLLDKYYIHTDYTNENIVVTDIMTSEDIIEQELKLLDAAEEELYADSHPQWNWSTSLDNLLLIPEFKPWHGQLNVGNYVRVTLREDDIVPMFSSGTGINVLSSIQEKLRVVMIGFNPFLLEDSIDVEFSTMVRYKSRRNDFASLMDLANASTKNKISSTMASYNRGNTINVDTTFLMSLLNNSKFNSYLNSTMTNFTTSGQLVDALSIGTAIIGKARMNELYLESGLIKKADIGEAHVTSYLDAVQVDAASITAGTLIADRILLRGSNQSVLYQLNTFGRSIDGRDDVPTVQEKVISNDKLEGYVLEPNTVNADRIVAHTITATEIHANAITAEEIAAHTITVDEITVDNLVGTNGSWINLYNGTFAFGTDKLTWDGSTLSIKGSVTATTGNIGGWVVNANYLGKGTIGQSGSAFLCPTGTTVTIGGTSRSNLVFTAGANFGVASDGALYSSSGNIAGWTIATNKLSNGTYGANNSMYLGTADLGSITIASNTRADWRLTIGSRFGVTNWGGLYCNYGKIGPWAISSDGLSDGNSYINQYGIQLTDLPASGTGSGSYKQALVQKGIFYICEGTWNYTSSNNQQANISYGNEITSKKIELTEVSTYKVTTITSNKITTPEIEAVSIRENGTLLVNKYAPLSSSDPVLKYNIADTTIKSAIELINCIPLHSFNWKKNDKHWDVGYIAPELYEIDDNMAVPPTGDDGSYWSVNDFYLSGLQTKAIQELAAENEELRRRIDRLENLYLQKLLER